MWIIIVVAGHLLNAIAFLIDKYLLTKQMPNPIVYSFMIGVLGLAAFVLAPFGLEILSPHEMIFSLLSGATFVLGLYFFFTSLKYSDASRSVTFIGALQPVLIFFLAFWWLGERLATNQIFSFILLLVGGTVISWEKVKTQHGESSHWIKYAIFAALFFAVSFVLVKNVFNGAHFISGLVWSRLGGAIMASLYLFIPQIRKNIFSGFKSTKNKKKAGGLVLVSQIGGALGFVLITYAISLASVTLVQAMQGIQYAFLFLMVAFLTWRFPRILKEKFTQEIVLQKVFAIVIIGIGLMVLAF